MGGEVKSAGACGNATHTFRSVAVSTHTHLSVPYTPLSQYPTHLSGHTHTPFGPTDLSGQLGQHLEPSTQTAGVLVGGA